MRILLVEDDNLLGDGVRVALTQEGYTVDWLDNGQSAELAILTESFDTIILDIGLPKRSGLEVLANIRHKGITTPVLILTAHDSVDQRVQGLDNGADDYLAKPFDLPELSARLRALQRRSAGCAKPVFTYDNIALDPAAHTVTKDGSRVNISPKEFSLLRKLLESSGRVLSRQQLAETLYGWDNDIDSNAVEVHVHNLRRKLGGELIRTIRGVGYMIDRVTN